MRSNIRPENIELTFLPAIISLYSQDMAFDKQCQLFSRQAFPPAPGRRDPITTNPKLLDKVREVMRLKHYAIRTETAYCDLIRRYVRFHEMKGLPGPPAGRAQDGTCS